MPPPATIAPKFPLAATLESDTKQRYPALPTAAAGNDPVAVVGKPRMALGLLTEFVARAIPHSSDIAGEVGHRSTAIFHTWLTGVTGEPVMFAKRM